MKRLFVVFAAVAFLSSSAFGQAPPAGGGVVPKVIPVTQQQPLGNSNVYGGNILSVYPKGILAVGADGKNFIQPKYGSTAAVMNGTNIPMMFQLSVRVYDAVIAPNTVNVWIKGATKKSEVVGQATCPALKSGKIKIEGPKLFMQHGDSIYVSATLSHVTQINAGAIDPITGLPVLTTIHGVLDQKAEFAHAVNSLTNPTP